METKTMPKGDYSDEFEFDGFNADFDRKEIESRGRNYSRISKLLAKEDALLHLQEDEKTQIKQTGLVLAIRAALGEINGN
jgi:hypothetical protein